MRTVFVLILSAIGAWYAATSPLYALLFYLWVAYFRPQDWIYSSNFILDNLSFILGAWVIILTTLSGKLRVQIGSLLFVLFLLHGLLGALLSPVPDVAWAGLVEFAKPAVISCLIIALVDTVPKLRLTMIVLAMSLAFEGAKQGWAELILHPGQMNDNTLPMLGDNNGVALGMLVLVSILVALARSASNIRERWLEQFLAVGVLYRALSTYSRGGFLAALALGAHFSMRTRYRLQAAFAAILLFVVAYTVLPDTFWARMSTIDAAVQTPGDVDSSTAGRLHFWAVALDIAADHPLTGTGMATYPSVYDRYDFSNGEFGSSRACHSSWFTLVAEVGYTGLLLFLSILGYAWWSCRQARRLEGKAGVPSELAIYGAGFEGGLLVFVVAGSFLSYQYAEIWWHVMALSIVTGRLAQEASRTATQSRLAS